MPADVADKVLDLAFSTDAPRAEIHYFGGEPLLQKNEMIRITEKAAEMAARKKTGAGFIVSTNCLGIDAAFADWAAALPFTFELSMDGSHAAAGAGAAAKPAVWRDAVKGAELLLSRNVPCFATAVVTPDTVEYLHDNISDIHSLGIHGVNITPATGMLWPAPAARKFADQLWRLHNDFFKHGKLTLLNLRNMTDEMLFNRELCVDCDGTIYAGNAFLFAPDAVAGKLALGHVNENNPASYYAGRIPPASFYIENVFPHDITLSYIRTIKVFQSYRKYFLLADNARKN